MTWLAVAFFIVWCTLAVLLVYGALVAAARADDAIEDGFDRDEGWCPDCNLPIEHCRHDEDASNDKCLLSPDDDGMDRG